MSRRRETKAAPQAEVNENPEDRAGLRSRVDDKGRFLFSCVAMDIKNDKSMGVWHRYGADSIRLTFELNYGHAEPYIEIRFTIKWMDGNISYHTRPAHPLFRVFDDQIGRIETLRVVKHEDLVDNSQDLVNVVSDTVPEQTNAPNIITFRQALRARIRGQKIPIFSELWDMDFGVGEKSGLEYLIEDQVLWVICLELKGPNLDNPARGTGNYKPSNPSKFQRYNRFNQDLFNKFKTYGTQTKDVQWFRDTFLEDNMLFFVVRGPSVANAVKVFHAPRPAAPNPPFKNPLPRHPSKPFQQNDSSVPSARPNPVSQVAINLQKDQKQNENNENNDEEDSIERCIRSIDAAFARKTRLRATDDVTDDNPIEDNYEMVDTWASEVTDRTDDPRWSGCSSSFT